MDKMKQIFFWNFASVFDVELWMSKIVFHFCSSGNVDEIKIFVSRIFVFTVICKHLSPFRQEDAHEFLRYLMEAMEKSYIAILGIQAKK